MARPSKSAAVLDDEALSHRTKAEIEDRKSAEEALTSGEKLKERADVRENKIAHWEFLRVNGR